MLRSTWHPKDLIAGIIVVAVGALALWEAYSYELGTPARMGPGLFPYGLSIILIGLGIGIMLFDARRPRNENSDRIKISLRALVTLPASILVFAFVIDRFGLGPATFLAVFTSTFADRSLTPVKSLTIAFVVAALCVVIFRLVLGLQVEAVKW